MKSGPLDALLDFAGIGLPVDHGRPGRGRPTLIQLGQVGHRAGLETLNLFKRLNLLERDEKVDEYGVMTRELLARQKRLWEKAIRLDPKLPGGYIGMAEYQYTVGDPDAAEKVLAQGIAECGLGKELVVAAGKLLSLTDPNRGLKFLERTIGDKDMTPTMCAVIEDVATKAGRPDKALDACRQTLQMDPTQDWARLREAVHFLKLGRPSDAVSALQPIADHLVKYPDACADHVRALSESGLTAAPTNFWRKWRPRTAPWTCS